MKRYMLDTDISSYMIRGDHPEVVDSFCKHFPNICISAITSAELLYGAAKRNSDILTQKVQAFCNLIPCVEWTLRTAQKYAILRSTLEKSGTPIGTMDMLIAASALTEDVILITNNIAHFSKVPDLKLDTWAH